MKKNLLLLFTLLVISPLLKAQIAVNTNTNAANLAQRLIGSGVNITNPVLNCPPLASGDFTVTASNLNLDSGIVLTSGIAETTPLSQGMNGPALGPSTDNNAPGDPDLTILAGQPTNDACILEFDFETTGDSVTFNYVFGSSEYPSFTCTNFNDVFGFFVSGPGIAGPYSNGAINIATVPGSNGTCPVGVSTIYCPTPGGNCCNTTNQSCHANTTGCGMFNATNNTCNYFVCNGTGTTVNYQGFTTVLRAEAQIIPCTTYHFKLAVADASDGILDSGVMIEAGSFSANEVGINLNSSITSVSGNPVLIEGCDSLKLDVQIEKHGIPNFDTVRFLIQGTAVNAHDYTFLADTLIFSPDPSDTIRTICIAAFQDGIPEGTETIVLYLQNFCSTALADSLTIEIIDSLGADFIINNTAVGTPDDSICLGDSYIFTPIVFPLNGIGPLSYSWEFGDGNVINNVGSVNQFHTYTQPGVYSVKLLVSDTSGCVDSAVRQVFVDIPPYVELSASPLEICVGEKVQFTDSIAPHTFNWVYDFDDGIILSGLHNPSHIYDKAGTYTATLTGEYLICPDDVKSVTIDVLDHPLINLGEDRSLCPGLDTAVILQNIENPNQILTWSTGKVATSITTNETGRYWATATSSNGACASTDSIWVRRDCYLNIPNSFSPNADGMNDYFIPRQLLSSGVIEFDMKIMNRWGEVIFKTSSINGRGWDGKYGGQDQPIGAYVYMITARWKNGFRNTFRGNVTLMR